MTKKKRDTIEIEIDFATACGIDAGRAARHEQKLSGDARTVVASHGLSLAVRDLIRLEAETCAIAGATDAGEKQLAGVRNARKMVVLAMRLLVDAFELDAPSPKSKPKPKPKRKAGAMSRGAVANRKDLRS